MKLQKHLVIVKNGKSEDSVSLSVTKQERKI